MNVPIRYVLILSAVLIISTALFIRQYMPREVTKTVTIEHTVTQTHEVIAPDGTRTIDSTTHVDEQVKTVDSKNPVPNWFVTAGSGFSFYQNKQIYMLSVNRRIIGPIFIGASGSSEGSIGIHIGVEL